MTQARGHLGAGFAEFAPLKIALGYILVTFTIAVLGPVQYVNFEKVRAGLFVFAVLVAIAIGYAIGVHSLASIRPSFAYLNPRRSPPSA